MHCLKVPLRVLVESTSWVGRSYRLVPILADVNWTKISRISSRFLFRRFLFLYFSTTHGNSGRLRVSVPTRTFPKEGYCGGGKGKVPYLHPRGPEEAKSHQFIFTRIQMWGGDEEERRGEAEEDAKYSKTRST